MLNTTQHEQIVILNTIVNDVRQDYDDHNCLGGVFADHCDAVSEIVLMVMSNHGFEGAYLVNGTYTHTYPDSDPDQYGHVWIEWNGLIIDPTRCQFDNHNFVTPESKNQEYNS